MFWKTFLNNNTSNSFFNYARRSLWRYLKNAYKKKAKESLKLSLVITNLTYTSHTSAKNWWIKDWLIDRYHNNLVLL